MKKNDLINRLAIKNNLTSSQAAMVVNLILDDLKAAMMRGDRIEIRGFGSLTMREYGTYAGRNPKTGQEVEVKPKRLPYFKVGKELKKRINGRIGST